MNSGTSTENSCQQGTYGGRLATDGTGNVMEITEADILNNETPMGGGVYIENYVNYDSLNMLDYQNLDIDSNTVFIQNKGNELYFPPEIVNSYSKINYKQTSVMGKEGYIHPINNYDINYIGQKTSKHISSNL